MNRTFDDLKNSKRQPFIGMKQEDLDNYSLLRAFRCHVSQQKFDGLEAEMSQEVTRCMGEPPEGFYIPHDLLFRGRRDLNASTFGAGGALVQTDVATDIIPLLRNKSVTARLGITVLDGLQGNLALPRQVGAALVKSVSETGALVTSSQVLDQVALSPRRAGVSVEYSRQLMLQSSPSVEKWLRSDLVAQLALRWDYLVLQGAGADDEPLGIFNTPGIASVLFGAAATYQKLLSFETALAVANADFGVMGWATSPACKGIWKGTARALTGATTVSSTALWEDWGDGSGDGKVTDYRAVSSNQILNNAAVLGHWSDSVLALWGQGTDWVINPFSKDTEGKIRVTGNSYLDHAVRHAQSFAWSADAGNQ